MRQKEPKDSDQFRQRIEQLRQAANTLEREAVAAELTDQVSAVAAAQVAIQAMIGELEISLRIAINRESETPQAREPHHQLEWTNCNREGCKCHQGGDQRHGPYWFSYTWEIGKDGEKGKMVRKYLSKAKAKELGL